MLWHQQHKIHLVCVLNLQHYCSRQCMLLNNFPIVSLVTLLTLFGLAFVLRLSPFKACVMENAQPFPKSNLEGPVLSILLSISHPSGDFTCSVLSIEMYPLLQLQKKSFLCI